MFTDSDTRIQAGTDAERADAYRDFFHDQITYDADRAVALRQALGDRDLDRLALLIEQTINNAEHRAHAELGTDAPEPTDAEIIAQRISEM
ncbi:hypothetical protein [Tomitella cavernea]|uniref:Uncharacterized protein n=1 Tax=Tomitella cavernea TaxID=1387982 RepID=A0ABP9D1S8_9ACTN|nr:hypothetical protein [Tomitella cavernea]